MLVYLYNTHLFYATKYKLVHWRIQQADTAGCRTRLIPIYKQHGERGNVGVVRERGRTADDRLIKAELHPPHGAGRQATVHPSRLLLISYLGFQELAAALTPSTHPCYCNNVGD